MLPQLEVYSNDGTVCIAKITEGNIDYISSDNMWNNSISPNDFKKCIRLSTEYRWVLPKNIRVISNDIPTLLDIHKRIKLCLIKYLWLSDNNNYDLIANWIISTYFRKQFKSLPILVFEGATSSGKTTALKLLNELVYRGELVTNASAPAIAREIMDWECTILLDGALENLSNNKRNELCNMINSCVDREGIWIRPDTKGLNNYKYEVYTNMAISIKRTSLPKDIHNKSIIIKMTSTPDNIQLEDIESCDEDYNSDSLTRLRTELYTLMTITTAYPTHDKAINFKERILTARQHLTMKKDDKIWMYAYSLGLPVNSPQIKNEDKKLALTMYSIGLETKTEKSIIEYVLKNNEQNTTIQGDTLEAILLKSLIGLIDEKIKKLGIWHSNINRTQFIMIVERISTVDISRKYNTNIYSQSATKETMITKTITANLNAMGLAYKRGQGNRTYLNARDTNFIQNFLKNVSIYVPKELYNYQNLT